MSSIIASSEPAAVPSTPGDRARDVVERLDAHRLGQPAGRVDGEHDDLAAALGGAQRERRGRGGLADPARAAADDDLGRAVVEQRVDVERRRGRRRRRPTSGPDRGACAARRHASPCSQQLGGELVERRRGRRRRAAAAARTSARRARSIQLALLVLELAALGVVAGLVEQPVDQRRRRRRRRPSAGRRASASAVERCRASSCVARPRRRGRCGRTRFTTTPPTGRPQARSSAMPSAVSCTGMSSSTVTRWTAVRGERSSVITVSAWRLDRADLGQPGELAVDVEELRDPAGRRRVEHDGVVLPGALVAAVALRRPRRPCRSAARRARPGAIVVAKSMTPNRSSALPARPSR